MKLAKCELCDKNHELAEADECPLAFVFSTNVWNRLQAAIKKAKKIAYDYGYSVAEYDQGNI